MTTTAISEKPILFSGEMVRAILDGRKTQTRRVIKPITNDDQGRTFKFRDGQIWASMTEDELAPLDEDPPKSVFGGRAVFDGEYAYTPIVVGKGPNGEGNPLCCPYGSVGDRLYVKETYGVCWSDGALTDPTMNYQADGAQYPILKSSPKFEQWREWYFKPRKTPWNPKHWRAGRFMPRWASRLTLEIDEIRVERLQEITEADAIAEGMVRDGEWWIGSLHRAKGTPKVFATAKWAFLDLWDKLNAKRGYSWESDPWVWVITFHRIEAN